nr:DUF4130 domain-containing protein [Acinetobacter baumannii]
MAQWTKKVGREKHRMEAFIRFKKTKDELFLSLVVRFNSVVFKSFSR